MTLDLTGRTPLSPEHAKALNELAIGLRPRIVALIDQMSSEQGNNIDWWVTPLASRNPFASRLFLSCCRIALLDRLLAIQQVPAEIWVDSRAMADLASRLGSRHGIRLQIRVARNQYLRDLVWRPVRSLLTALYHVVMQFACARLLLPRPLASGNSSHIVVDTFLYSGSIREGAFHDRHFPGIAQSLTAEERSRLRYFPTFYKVRNYPKLFRQLRGLRGSFLFKEDHLRLRDYFYAFGHGIRIWRIRPGASLMLNGLPLNALMLEELRRGWMWPSAIEALLKYRAIFRMSEAGIKIGRVLDWFENQDIDRGANAGFRRYYPGTEVVGYIGYVASQHYLCMYPTPAEVKAGVLPTRFAVMGRGFIDTLKEFCPDLVVEVAPALRYSEQTPSSERNSEELSIVVALPVVRAEALEILDAIRHLLHGLKETSLAATKVHVRIKPHPASDIPRDDSFGLAPGAGVRVTWVSEKLDLLLRQADVLVSAASSACFEALTMDVPVVVLGSSYGITFIPIPQAIPQGRWQVCYSWNEMLSAIMAFRGAAAPDRDMDIALRLQAEYLEPVDRQGVRRLVLGSSSAAQTTE
ncbi:MAG: hypothetical protein WA056_07255 [Gallionella sp.]